MFFNMLEKSGVKGRGRIFVLNPFVFSIALVFFTIFGFSSVSHAQSRSLHAANLESNTESLSLSPYTIVQKDRENKITPESIEASSGSILRGRIPKSSMIDIGYDGTPAWLSFRLHNNSTETNWTLAPVTTSEGKLGYIKTFKVYEMDYVPASPDGLQPAKVTLTEIFAGSQNGGYKIRLEKDQERLILINVAAAAGKPGVFPLTLYSENVYLETAREQSTYDMFFGSILVALALVFLVRSITRQDASELIYGAYFVYMAVRWAVPDNLILVLGPTVFDGLFVFMILVGCVLAMLMTKIFFGITVEDRTEKLILYGLFILDCTATGIAFLWPGQGDFLLANVLHFPFVLTMIAIMIISYGRLKERSFPALIYLLSWAFPTVGLFLALLSSSGILPQNPFLLNCFWYSLLIQGALLIPSITRQYIFTDNNEEAIRTRKNSETLNLSRLKETKDIADHSRLLKVIEKERSVLAELRAKEEIRIGEMRKAKEMADEANRAKSAFLAVVSHEIRTPMTGVMGMVKLLLESNITKQQRDYATTILESSESMMALLNDILDFEKIQRGKMELENISFDLHRLIHGVVTLMSGHAAEKGITMSARIDENLPKFVKGDPTRLRQILLNLMGNGIKFTSKGSVTLLVKSLNQPEQADIPDSNGKYMVYFAIQDTGIGISAEGQKNLFNPFAQANSSISRKFGGSGLGLAISKGLIESMKSSINLSSKEGEGSNFFFTLEMEKGLATSQEPMRKTSSADDLGKPAVPLKILVVDDNTIIRKVIISLLSEDKHQITTATTAEEALKKIDENTYDIILMDIELPGMHGNEATRIIREQADPVKSALPIIAMTGNVSKEDMERYLGDGMTGFLGKPIDAGKLKSIVNEIARKTFEREIKLPATNVAAQEKPKENIRNFFDETQEDLPMEGDGIFNAHMLQSLKDTIGGNQLNELLNDLIVKTDEILQAMIEASKIGDLKTLAARAHELKGMAGNFGLVEISSIAEETEKKAKTEEIEGLDDLVCTLPEARTRAQEVLKNWAAH